MRSRDIFILTTSGNSDPSLAIAACRAGSRGVLDLEYATEPAHVRENLDRLDQFTDSPYGVTLSPDSLPLLDLVQAHSADHLRWIVLVGGDHAHLGPWIDRFRRDGREVFIEAINLTEARLAVELGANGVILKGHESAGRVGDQTAFILLQSWMAEARRNDWDLPVWVRGGIGLHTAGACLAGGAAGVVLDSQVLLAKESPLDDEARTWLSAADGSETVLLGERLGEAFRVYARPGWKGIERAAREEEKLDLEDREEGRAAWRELLRELVGTADPESLWPLGADASFAKPLAAKFRTVAGIIQGIAQSANDHLEAARRQQPLAKGASLAKRLGTTYPILQGPMTRVSDTGPFAAAVAEGGALPFLALALLRRAETEALLKDTQSRVGDRPWGVGILGFVPNEIRNEQLAAIRAYKPPFAIIAGGRPDQAKELEDQGIKTYLHVPSPGLLRRFLKDGARRFIFEGRECGGHVGPRTSFVLWETMVAELLDSLGSSSGEDLDVIFAGGIHDARSAAMLSVLAAKLAERGVAVGGLMGTAYLFTREAVECGAITEQFQQEAVGCRETVLLQSGPGHAIRCVPTPYFDHFEAEKRRLRQEGKSHEEVAKALEWMNMGRLRVASKGLDRGSNGTGPSKLVEVSREEQHQRGMYMIGQVAALHDEVTTIAELHQDVAVGGSEMLAGLQPTIELVEEPPAPQPCDVAIVGMSCFYPKANGLASYWENILGKVNAVIEVPESHWDWKLYYDPNPRAKDKIISKWGGFLDDIHFDPTNYGITPRSLYSIEPLQLYLLETVRLAIRHAGYENRPFSRERTAAILGVGGGGSPVAVAYGFRACLPLLDNVPGFPVKSDVTMKHCEEILPEWTEDSFPGFLLNVAVGRVSNRFNFGGPNYAIDAACGSSLAALYACVRELEMGTSDVAIAMGADTVQTPLAYMAFSKTHALSPQGRCRPFDAGADGIALSEGFGAVVLKRLADAERDGDTIYAVIKGIGSSSDGRAKGLTAPRAEGQVRALKRAYAHSGVSPARVGLVEAHGTGTVVGDQTESQALSEFFSEYGAEIQSCALGSVKSMIGHSKCAAGIAGLIKATLALHHKILPPTLVEKPNPNGNYFTGPLYLNTESRPWVHSGDQPRVAGVSAFGFGGTNFHTVLEEYTRDYTGEQESGLRTWAAELFVWRRKDRAELTKAVGQMAKGLDTGATPRLADLAAGLWQTDPGDAQFPTLAIVATSLEDLREKLTVAETILAGKDVKLNDPRGVYLNEKPADTAGGVAFLFPGQGSQYPNMLAEVAMAFDEVRKSIERAEATLRDAYDRPLGRFIYPASTFTPEQEREVLTNLTQTEVAQPAIGSASLGLFTLLSQLGLKPDMAAGHSYGELAALCAAGVMTEEDLSWLSHRRGTVMVEATAQGGAGTMAAIDADADRIAEVLAGMESITLANRNSPSQTVISGSVEAIDAALAKCTEAGLRGRKIPVAAAFHSPLIADAKQPLAEALSAVQFRRPRFPVYANTTARPHAEDPGQIRELMAEHLVSPVRFREQVEAMFTAGARVFVEVGPGQVLTGLVKQTLHEKDVLAVASDVKGRSGLTQLCHVVGQLIARGIKLDLDRLFEGRGVEPVRPSELNAETGKPKVTPMTWMVNSVRNRPHSASEPLVLGQSPSPDHPAMKSQPKEPASQPMNGHHSMHDPEQPSSSDRWARVERSGTNGTHTNGTHHTPPPTPAPVPPVVDEAAQVMLRFQDLMSKFLETQQAVMANFLGGGSVPNPSPTSMSVPTPPSAPGTNGVYDTPMSSQASTMPTTSERNGDHPPVAPTASSNGQHVESAPVEVPAEAPTEQLDREWFSSRLQDLVSDRTGYPKDMLGLDLDLEADLGIDSIKRVEILGELAEMVEDSGSEDLAGNLEMEKLTTLKTLRAIIDYLEQALTAGGTQADAPVSGTAPTPSIASGCGISEVQHEIQRAIVRLIDAPPSGNGSVVLPAGAVLFTDDGRGVAQAIADKLADFGQRVVFLREGEATADDSDVFHGRLTDPDSVADLMTRVRQEVGTIGGFVHLLPLAEPGDLNDRERTERDVKSVFLFARELGDDLHRAASEGGAVLLTATSLGGDLGFSDEPLSSSYFAGHGAILGFTKSLALEWPEVLVRAVDLDLEESGAERLADQLLSEMADPNGPVEVGHHADRRLTWEPVAAPLDADAPSLLALDDESVVLITGGARGITATIAEALARRYRPTLVLVGRSPLPEDTDPKDVADLDEPATIKKALIERMQREGRPVAPVAIEADFTRLMRDREIRANLARIRSAGSKLEYHTIDVRDADAVTRLVTDVRKRHGKIDGVIHGAGVNEDKLVKDKSPDSFDRVFATKVASAWAFREALNPEELKFFALFASIASRYGNRGQSDYAAANETLAKLAHELGRLWPCPVFAFDWGPWSEVGMGAELAKHMVARGVKMISPEEGQSFFIDELERGDGSREVIIAGGGENIASRHLGEARESVVMAK